MHTNGSDPLKEIFTTHMAGAMRTVAHYSKIHPMLSDDFHDAVVTTMIHLDQSEVEPNHPAAYVRRCMEVACMRVLKRLGNRVMKIRLAKPIDFDMEGESASHEDRIEAAELAALIEAELPEPEMEAIRLVDIEGYHNGGERRNHAKRLGVGMSGVYFRRNKGLNRARRILMNAGAM